MKAFLKTYWMETAFFAVGLLGAVIAYPFLPESVPVQWHDGQVSSTGPKWILLILSLAQFAASTVCHYALKRYFDKFPALAPTLSGMERLASLFLSAVILTCQLCSMLSAWGVAVSVEVVLLVELLLVPVVLLAFVASKFFKKIP